MTAAARPGAGIIHAVTRPLASLRQTPSVTLQMRVVAPTPAASRRTLQFAGLAPVPAISRRNVLVRLLGVRRMLQRQMDKLAETRERVFRALLVSVRLRTRSVGR